MMFAVRTRSETILHAMGMEAVAVEMHATLKAANAARSVIRMSGTQSQRTQSARPRVQPRIRRAQTASVNNSGVHLSPSAAVTSAWPRKASAVKMRTGTILVAARKAHVAVMHVQGKEASVANR